MSNWVTAWGAAFTISVLTGVVGYVGASIIPAIAQLQAQADYLRADYTHLHRSLDAIFVEVREVNKILAVCRTQTGDNYD